MYQDSLREPARVRVSDWNFSGMSSGAQYLCMCSTAPRLNRVATRSALSTRSSVTSRPPRCPPDKHRSPNAHRLSHSTRLTCRKHRIWRTLFAQNSRCVVIACSISQQRRTPDFASSALPSVTSLPPTKRETQPCQSALLCAPALLTNLISAYGSRAEATATCTAFSEQSRSAGCSKLTSPTMRQSDTSPIVSRNSVSKMNSFVLAQLPDQPSSLVRVTVWCLTGNQR